MMWRRNSTLLTRIGLYPHDRIHCSCCGAYPRNGFVSISSNGCCSWSRPEAVLIQRSLDFY